MSQNNNNYYPPPNYPPSGQPEYGSHNQQQTYGYGGGGSGAAHHNQNQDGTYYVNPDLENMKNEKPQPSQNFDESFKIEKPRFNDWPFAIFFLLTVAGFIAVAGITVNALRATYGDQGSGIYNSSDSFTMNRNTVILFAFVLVLSIVMSALGMMFIRAFAKTFIYVACILNVVLSIGTAIFYFVEHYYSAAIVFLIFGLFAAFCYWRARSRIPLSATILRIVIDVMKQYPSTLVTSFFGLVISAGFGALFSVVIIGTYVKFKPNADNTGCEVGGGSCSQAKLVGVLVFVFFAGYYISEVIKNVIHVTISGIYGTWYYLANSDQGAPKHPALSSLKRAMTYCFGSICFGSLIVTIIQLIKQLLNIVASQFVDSWGGQCAMLIVNFIMSFINWLVQYFNKYAYSYVGLYGKSYIRSAKDTFDLFRFKGMDALVNDMFINNALHFYSLFVAYLSSLLAYLYLKFTKPGYNDDGNYYAPVVAFTFLISMQICNITLSVIQSGVATFFVCLAKDPEVLQMSQRDELFNEIQKNYPQVYQKITTDH
ncbi:choline transporter-like family protein [Acetobacter pasteurianus]|uniref:Protein PNS1 n=1 Tax=Lodderomyces elongisporus (strain ATCC 11503 / CBS 2605 / JCM 1781 / NBRC 1676 / NRRL YB-4239) TaxID=379508 RepID=A5DVT0_LODEL|nr:pH nine-sensitive protein 1 [Lodderomyces elongisporus]EDK43288.1 protein PNS1 [Lodderomyces elongisporus NRRL YB-4239]MDC6271010.1 choline transporter-like family protein [Acetobacter pasteurianus]WLF77716.1 pH nine-sensitive protein 1 [Lodderomyces elongisporus]